ncbi:MAG: nucleotidyl transferase AbiEii/AbiGii toxin family protein [Bdellovibrionales bacterium]|nr:nucleotidyl transferase AbiEii/AbiGii toxin family protein [Bdellovibrionales bacterium]
MTKDSALRESITRIHRVLTDHSIQFHFTGGIASTYYGEPRFTQDLDIVLRISCHASDIKSLISNLEKKYILDETVITDAIKHRRMFQALDKSTFVKIDFYSDEKIPNELSRSVPTEILPGLTVPLVSVEDAILSKLLWIKGGSEKAKRDIEGMMRANKHLQFEYIEKTAHLLGLSNLFKEMLSQVSIDNKKAE